MRNGHAFTGMITPSSNTVIERVACAILADLPDASCHFARIPFVGAKIHEADTYDFDAMLTAARLLADAELDSIVWNGSKAGAIAFDLDRELARRIHDATGIVASTSVLAVDEVFRATGVRRYGLITPFADAYQQKVLRVFAGEGYDCAAQRHLGLSDNYSFSTVPEDQIRQMAHEVAAARPDALLAFCTNFRAAPLIAELESTLGIPVYDSVSIGVWKGLRLAGLDTASAAARWGSLFAR
jgi:maleate isomerase